MKDGIAILLLQNGRSFLHKFTISTYPTSILPFKFVKIRRFDINIVQFPSILREDDYENTHNCTFLNNIVKKQLQSWLFSLIYAAHWVVGVQYIKVTHAVEIIPVENQQSITIAERLEENHSIQIRVDVMDETTLSQKFSMSHWGHSLQV